MFSIRQKICKTSSRQSPSTESTGAPQPKRASHPSRTNPPRPAGHTVHTSRQRPQSLHSNTSQQRNQQQEPKLVRGRVRAVTSTARTTAPESERDRRLREKYPRQVAPWTRLDRSRLTIY